MSNPAQKGADGDHVDCYVGPSPESKTVYVVDQIDAKTGAFDEHKCLIGYETEAAAVSDYVKAFSDGKGRSRIGAVTQMPMDAFKAWLRVGSTSQPLGDLRKGYASGGAVTDILKGVYGEGFQPEEGLDQPYHDTSELAERMQRYAAVPEWMKTVAEYDPTLGHFLQASPWGGYPEALERKDLAIGPLGTLPWLAWGAGKALLGKPAFDTAKNAAREQLWEQILSAPAMARAQGGRAGEADQETKAQTAEGGRAFELEYRPEQPAMELAQRYYSGDLAPEPLESDFEKTLNAYEPLRNFQPMGQAELRGTGPGESRSPTRLMGYTEGERPQDAMAPVAELISPTLGGYGMGQMAGEVGMNLSEGEYGDAALGAAVLGVGALVPGPDGKPIRVPREIDSRGFYSPSLEAAKSIPQDIGTVQQMTAMLLKQGAKPKELEAVGYHKAFPDPQAKVSRAEIEQYLRDNRVQLGNEVYAGQRDDFDNPVGEVDALDLPRYESYSTPGGIPGSYREVVTTLPDSYDARVAAMRQELRDMGHEFNPVARFAPGSREGELHDAINALETERGTQRYTSSHWPGITNPLLHYRVKDFAASGDDVATHAFDSIARERFEKPYHALDGRQQQAVIEAAGDKGWHAPPKIRVLDEMQSDWAQRARDQGFRDPQIAQQRMAELEAAKVEHAEYDKRIKAIETDAILHELGVMEVDGTLKPFAVQRIIDNPSHPDAVKLKAMQDEIIALKDKRRESGNRIMDLSNKVNTAMHDGVPSAPYISSTSDWVDLGLKQALIDAAKDPSVSRLAWAPGKVQADRYDMGRVADAFRYNPERGSFQYKPAGHDHWSMLSTGSRGEITPDNLPEVIGKEMAERLLAQPRAHDPTLAGLDGHGWHVLDNLGGQHIGGAGHKAFYGDMTPEGYQSGIVGTRLQKLVKGLDPEAARVEPTTITPADRSDLPSWSVPKDSKLNPRDYPSIPITPAMREKILKEGLPLFLTPLGVGVAQGLELSDDPVGDILRHHYGEESPPQFADGGTVRDITQASLTPAGLGEPRPAAKEDYAWSPLPLPPGEVSPVAQMEAARKRALSPLVSEGSWLAGYPARVYHRLMGRNPDGSERIDPRGIMNKATPHGADNQALMDGVAGLTPKDWKVEGRESKNVIDRRSKDPWSYD